MTRYYYTDPLKAAWMAREFGMKLICYYEPEDEGLEYAGDEESYPFEHAAIHAEMWGDVITEKCRRQYIHPDSLKILEPQVGDLILFEWGALTYVTPAWVHEFKDGECRVVCGPQGPDDICLPIEECEIIQRNGKAFFWPEDGE